VEVTVRVHEEVPSTLHSRLRYAVLRYVPTYIIVMLGVAMLLMVLLGVGSAWWWSMIFVPLMMFTLLWRMSGPIPELEGSASDSRPGIELPGEVGTNRKGSMGLFDAVMGLGQGRLIPTIGAAMTVMIILLMWTGGPSYPGLLLISGSLALHPFLRIRDRHFADTIVIFTIIYEFVFLLPSYLILQALPSMDMGGPNGLFNVLFITPLRMLHLIDGSMIGPFFRVDSLSGGFYLTIRFGCSGYTTAGVMLSLFWSNTIARPRKVSARFIISGTVLIVVLTYLFNLIRILLIILTGVSYGIEAMTNAHTLTGEIVLILLALVFWRFSVDRLENRYPRAVTS